MKNQTNNNLVVKCVFGSWKAYNECNERALGSSYLDLDSFNSSAEIYQEMKKQGFTDAELEETFVQDFEAENAEDLLLFSNCDMTSINEAFNIYQEAKKELAAKQEAKPNYTITINKYKAVEIHFNDKPNSEVLEALKKNGFRWFKPSSSWSAFKTIEEAQAILNGVASGVVVDADAEPKQTYKFKALTLIDDFNEKVEIIKKCYEGNYVESMLNSGNPKDVEFAKKNIIGGRMLLKTSDNYILNLSIEKPTIECQMWYDDEQEAPKNTYENFKLHNINQNLHNAKLNAGTKMFLFKDGNQYVVAHSFYGFGKDEYIRDLTDAETEDLNHIYKETEAAYEKRLASYWKRYQSKIHWSGYWVNR